MNDKIKKLKIKKLVQEYNFLLTEDEYVKEVVGEHKNVFMENVFEMRKKLNIPFKDHGEVSNEDLKENKDSKKIEDVSESTKIKIKKIYRDIVKLTHPDKTNSEKHIELYRKATEAAENFNILDLFQICVELNIPTQLDMEDIDTLTFLIKQKKDELKKIESSFIWLWFTAENEDNKNKIIELFVRQTS